MANISNTPEYLAWRDMIRRCTDPRNKDFRHYGARGVVVCPAWLESFDNFFADMGFRPDGRSLDRIENELGYEPGNCRWATKSQQNKNRRSHGPFVGKRRRAA